MPAPPIQPEISVVVPALNESEGLGDLVHQLRETLGANASWEIVIVDDGSTDDSIGVLTALHQDDPRIRYVSLSRNFGHQAALRAGIEHARGRCVATMDADLQHPPEMLKTMLDRWHAGDEIVSTVREEDQHQSFFKRNTSRLFYSLINFLGDVRIEPGSADFFLIDRKVVEQIRALPDRDVFFRGLLPWLGFRRCTLRYKPGERAHGQSRYSIAKMLRLATTGVLAHSLQPLRIASVLAGIIALLAVLYTVYSVVVYLVLDAVVPGWTSVIVVVSLIGALQLLVLGIIGEYLGRMFRQTQGRPGYIVRDSNTSPPPAHAAQRLGDRSIEPRMSPAREPEVVIKDSSDAIRNP